MKANLQATRVLFLDTSLILAVSVALILLNLFLVERIDGQLENIDEVRAQKVELLKKMKKIVRQRSIVMVDLASEKDAWDFQDKYTQFHRLALDFINARDTLDRLGLDTSERTALDAALKTIRKTETIQNDIVERLRESIMEDRSIAGIHDEIAKIDFPAEFALLGQMEELFERVVEHANMQRVEAKRDFDHLLIIAGTLSFISLFAIIFLMSRSMRKIRVIESDLLSKTESLGWDATHDPLTNIFNRRWLEHKIEGLTAESSSESPEHSLMCIDLDGFKDINDNYGHKAGDVFLNQFCREAEHTIRHNDTFCRMGGDEFAILLENCDEQNALKIANELLHRIRKFHVDFENNRLQVTCSIGICQFSANDIEFEDLIRRADELCYEAKRKGKDRAELGSYKY